MDLWKRIKACVFVDNGLFLGVVLVMLVGVSFTFFIDWRGPVDEMPSAQREHAEECLVAKRSLGADVDRYRTDCDDVLHPRSAAMTVERSTSK